MLKVILIPAFLVSICIGATETSSTTAKKFSSKEIEKVMMDYLNTHTHDGKVELQVLESGNQKDMKLKLVKIHYPLRKITDTDYFVCADLKDTQADAATKKQNTYDIDFWFTVTEGKLQLVADKTEVHKINGKKLFDYNKSGEKVPTPPVG